VPGVHPARSRGKVAAVIGTLAVLTAGLALLALRGTSPEPAAPRARAYRDVDVCLFTGPRGLTADPAHQAWQGLQTLSRTGRARVSYVSVPAPDTLKAAGPLLAGLVQRRCTVIVAAGAAEVAAIDATAARAPAVHFVRLAPDAGKHSNTISLDPASSALSATLVTTIQRFVGT
jgi:hypothetical protein